MTDIAFYIIAAGLAASALYVAFSPDLIRSAFMLLFNLSLTAGLYLLMSSDFLAVIQLLIYVGGILVVFLFAILMLRHRMHDSQNNPHSFRFAALLLASAFLLLTAAVFMRIPSSASVHEWIPVTEQLGLLLTGPYLIHFEILSLLLLAGLIGSAALVRSSDHPGGRGGQNP